MTDDKPTAGPSPAEGAPDLERIARTICCPSGKCRARYAGHDCNWPGEIEEARAVLTLFAPSPQPPAPAEGTSPLAQFAADLAARQEPLGAEFAKVLDDSRYELYARQSPADGGTDVSGLVKRLKVLAHRCSPLVGTEIMAAADALTAQAAEIERQHRDHVLTLCDRREWEDKAGIAAREQEFPMSAKNEP